MSNTPDLSHWDTERYLSIHEISALISGFDPYFGASQITDQNLRSRYALASTQLERDCKAEIERFKYALHVYWTDMPWFDSDMPEGLQSIERHMRLRVGIRSRSLEWHLDNSTSMFPENLPEIDYCEPLALYDGAQSVAPLDSQVFDRDEVNRWCDERGWKTAYDFQGWRVNDEPPPQSKPLLEIKADARPDLDGGAWPWGSHNTKLLEALAKTADRWWKNYDPGDATTAPTNEAVTQWIVEQKIASDNIARAIATILRADGLRMGPRK